MKKLLFFMLLMMATLVTYGQVSACEIESKATIIKTADLQKAITDNIAKDYPGYTIKEAVCITAGEVITFEIVVIKENTSWKLTYDKDGKFVKKVARKVIVRPATKK